MHMSQKLLGLATFNCVVWHLFVDSGQVLQLPHLYLLLFCQELTTVTHCCLVLLIANIDRPSFIAELSSVSEFSSVENANQFCDFLCTVLDKHAPPSLRKVITHSSSPWFESIRDELFIAKRERRQAERKWRNTKLAIFKDLYGQAKHNIFNTCAHSQV